MRVTILVSVWASNPRVCEQDNNDEGFSGRLYEVSATSGVGIV